LRTIGLTTSELVVHIGDGTTEQNISFLVYF